MTFEFSLNNTNRTGTKSRRQEANHLASLVEYSSEAIISTGMDRRIISWNKGAGKLFGYTQDETTGKTAEELGLFTAGTVNVQDLEKELHQTGEFSGERIYHRRNGSSFIGLATISVIKNISGQASGLVIIIRDISAQRHLYNELTALNKKLEQKVRERTEELSRKKEMFQVMLENNNEIILLIGADKQVIYRSPSAIRITGWNDSEVRNSSILYESTHPDDKVRMRGYIREAAKNPGKTVPVRVRMLHKKGYYMHMEGSIRNLLEDRKINAVIFNVRDITERVTREEELNISHRQLIESSEQLALFIGYSPAAIAMFDKDMRYMAASNRWLNDYNLGGNKIIGKSHYDIFPEIGESWKEIHQYCLKGNFSKKEEDLFIRSDGSKTWLRWEIRPWHLASGEVGGIIIFTEDITVRKTSEEITRISEKKYRTLVERISDGFVAVDRDWNFTFINHVAESMFGQNAEGLIGRNAMEVFNWAENDPFFIAYQKAMETQQHIQLRDYSNIVGRWMQVNIYPSPTGLSIYFRDITEQRKAEIAIQRSESIRKKIMNSALDAIICADSFGNITYWNKRAETLFGWTAGEASGMTLADTIIPAAFRERHRTAFAEYKETGRGHMLNTLMEITAVKRDGSEFPIELFIVPVNEDSENFFCIYIRDISIRRKAQEKMLQTQKRFIQAQEIAHLGNWELDFEKRTSQWSDEAYRIYGLEPGDQYYSVDDWLKLVHPEDMPRVKRDIQTAMAEQRDFSFYHRIIRPDGELRYLYAESKIKFNEEGEPRGLYGIVHDITRVRQLESELQQQQREEHKRVTSVALESQEKERNLIGAELHDNVNQILATAKILLSTLKDEGKNAEIIGMTSGYVQQAIDENRKIAHELSTPDFTEYNLVQQVTNLAESMLAPAGIVVNIATPGLEEKRLDDARKLAVYRIAQEQCTNIIKYAGATEVNIIMKTSNGNFRMVISDNGAGMDQGKKVNGIGIKNIKARLSVFDGKLKTETAPGSGFLLRFNMPLQVNGVHRR